MKMPDTFDVIKGRAKLGATYGADMTKFHKSYMEFVLTGDGWIRVKWDVPATEVLRGMAIAFEVTKNQMDMTVRSANQLAEEMRRWYGPAT